MRLTTARYYTPSGRSIQAVGVTPDIAVEQGKFEAQTNAEPTRRERDLKGALDTPKDGDKKDDKAGEKKDDKTAEKPADKPPADYQMERAIDMMKAISLYEMRKAQR
jgi:carboxyl-terminal processing protease